MKSYDADSLIQAAANRQDNSRTGQNARKSPANILPGAAQKKRPAKAGRKEALPE
jgi:hypothetical protein